jgi:hypothetical protein
MKTTQAEIRRHLAYKQNPSYNSLGNLHERMRCVRVLADTVHKSLPNDLYQAILDLELEVSFHEPADPPYGHRDSKLGMGIGTR